jgi:hypothetical protein
MSGWQARMSFYFSDFGRWTAIEEIGGLHCVPIFRQKYRNIGII